MGRIIAIANQKGGVGKTTTAVNLSAALAARGKKTLIIDMDPQGNTTTGLGLDKNNLDKTIYEVITDEYSIQECIREELFDNLSLLPANRNLAGAEIELMTVDRMQYIVKENQKKIYAGSERGVRLYALTDRMEHCGIGVFQAKKLKVYDYLSLFHAGKSIGQEMTIAVFPTESSIETQLWAFLESQGSILPAQAAKGAREDGDEVRQIREYRQGDFVRHIHWNQSARTGQYWVKEYERETNAQVCLWIDLSGQRRAARRQLDAFYELLWSFLVGMLKRDMAVQAFWREEGGK